MMKTLFLHIGTAKTGTTSIQFFCRENEELLKQRGYCYPKSPKAYPFVSKAKNGHMLEATIRDKEGNRLLEEEEKDFQACIAMIKKQFETYDTVILSDEAIWRDLSLGHKDVLQKVAREAKAAGFALKVIVYLRRQDLMAVSIWNQYVKAPQMVTPYNFEDFCKNMRMDAWLAYDEKLDKIVREVGRENVIVRRFEPQNFYGGNIFQDFFYATGIPWSDDYVITEEVRNTRLSGNAVEIKRILNGLPKTNNVEYQKILRDVLLECSDTPTASLYSSEVLTPDEARVFMKDYEACNRKVAQEFFGEDELFDMTMEDRGKWEPNNAYMMEDVIRFAGVLGMHLMKENNKLKKEVRDLKSKLKHPARAVTSQICKKFSGGSDEG